jgi:hypothetical protein
MKSDSIIYNTDTELARSEESGKLSIGIIDNRVALHIILRSVQLNLFNAYHIVTLGVVVTSLGLDDVVIVDKHTTTRIATYTRLGIETEIIGIEQGIAIDDLDNGGINLRYASIAIVDCAITIYIYGVLIDDKASEEAPSRIAITNGAIA